MEDKKEFTAREPDFKGDGVAVWLAKDKNGQTYLNIKVLNSIHVRAFKHVPKPKKEEF